MRSFFSNYWNNLQELHADVRLALKGLPLEALNWSPGKEMNSMAVLVVHLAGAERYWIVDVLTGKPSTRDRNAEFKVQGISEGELVKRLTEAENTIQLTLESLALDDLNESRTSQRDGRQFSVGWALCHALKHTALHLGQIQLTRQLWDQHQNT